MADESINTSIEENQDGLAITPEGDGGQTPEPVVEETVIPETEETVETVIQDEHEEPLPQVTDQNALRSWLGRRDKRTEEKFDAKLKQTVDSLVLGIAPLLKDAQRRPDDYIPPTPPRVITAEELDFINDPVGSFNKLFQSAAPTFATDYIPKYNAEYSTRVAQKAGQILNGVEFLAKADPVVKEDSARIAEIARTLSVPNFDSIDVATATKIAFAEAQNILLREKMQKKVNPLAGNKPVTKPIGSLSPSAPGKQVQPRPAVSKEVMEQGMKMGLSEDKIYELLK